MGPPPTGFVAYASTPREIGQTISAAVSTLKTEHRMDGLHGWEENDIAGRFLVTPILDNIDAGDILVADVTKLNFNVTFEIGYAIGRKKRVVLVRNSSLTSDDNLIRDIGIFDTLGYLPYSTSGQLVSYILGISDITPLAFDETIDAKAPVFVVQPPIKTDVELRMMGRIKKARLQFRHYDPAEVGRLPASAAIADVAKSIGVVAPLLPANRKDAVVHNMRAAFIGGLCLGMDKILLLMQAGTSEPVPLDYRDLVGVFNTLDDINELIADFGPQITEKYQLGIEPPVDEPKDFLARLSLGSSIAENEMRELAHYYIYTDEYQRTEKGEIQLVVGRKGAGKTALFSRLRDRLRRQQQRIVLDLQPEGFQLLKFKEHVLSLMEQGTKEHTVAAFWEYVLLLEVAYKILEKDRIPHTRNHELYAPYRELETLYKRPEYTASGDFAERMQWLIEGLENRFCQQPAEGSESVTFTRADVTEFLYTHDIRKLQSKVFEYLKLKAGLWVLVDNLDKGWPPSGLTPDDLLLIRALIDASNNLRQQLAKLDVESNSVVFLRNDVSELLMDFTPDRGKLSSVKVNWTDPELLRELLRLRFVHSGADYEASFTDVWRQLCVSHVEGEESSQFVIDRCLLRPRALIDLFGYCRSHAVNLRKAKIDAEDFLHGEEAYSTELVHQIGYELRDVFPAAEDCLYELIEAPRRIRHGDLKSRLSASGISVDEINTLIELLLWFGVIGLSRGEDETAYIYDVKYDRKRLLKLVGDAGDGTFYEVNPAFWKGLDIKH